MPLCLRSRIAVAENLKQLGTQTPSPRACEPRHLKKRNMNCHTVQWHKHILAWPLHLPRALHILVRNPLDPLVFCDFIVLAYAVPSARNTVIKLDLCLYNVMLCAAIFILDLYRKLRSHSHSALEHMNGTISYRARFELHPWSCLLCCFACPMST